MLERHTEDALASWTVGPCAFTIDYSLRVIDDIRLDVVDAFFSLPRGGAEIGGILLGRDEGHRVTITDYVPLDCEHAFGPSFVLSPKDHVKLAEMLAWARGNPGGNQPVGWYHSHTRSEIQLSEADLDIHQRYFPEPWQVALVLKPHTFQPVRAGFFFREADGSIQAAASYLEFVLDSSAKPPFADPSATAPPPHRLEPEPVAAIGLPSKPLTEAAALEPLTPAGARRKKRVMLKAGLGVCALALVFAAGTLVNSRSFRDRSGDLLRSISNPAPANSVSVSPPPMMGLRAKRQNGDLELTWSRDSAVIAAATSGVISIEDGGSKRKIDLNSTQVRGGSLLYSPTSDQILMQLTVTTRGDTATESVMVILPKVGGPQTIQLPAPRTSAASVAAPAVQTDNTQLAKASRPFTASSAGKGDLSPALPVLTDSPPLKLNLDPSAAVAPNFVPQAPIPPPPALPQSAPSQPAPQGTSSRPAAPSQQPAQPGQIVVRYEPAVAIRKTAPALPAEMQTFATSRKVIEVKVTIDKNGRVSKAEAIPQKNVSQFLINSAVNAALQWRFQPARRDDEPIASESVLQFVFGK